jgi:hypothetical protein
MSNPLDTGNINLCPTFAEMAARMRSKARNLRYRASKYGEDTPKGRDALASAESYERIAAGLLEKAVEEMHARDGMLAEYRKSAANRGAAL